MIDPTRPDFADTPASPGRPRGGFAPADPDAVPAVSVVTPFYRPGALFHETARSLFAQSLQQWEWWIVNDGSPDRDSLAVLEAYRDLDPRIHVLDHPHNRGLPAARNTGIAAARAPYVYLLDDDDLIEPTALEKTLWHLDAHPELAFANGWSVGFGAQEYLWSRGFEAAEGFLESNGVSGRALLRRRVWEEVGGYDESLVDGFEDWDFWMRCAARGEWGGTLPEYLDWYRRRSDHGDRWRNLAVPERLSAFRGHLRERHPRLAAGAFPSRRPAPRPAFPEAAPCANELAPAASRLLLLVPWLTVGGADSFNLDLVEQLTRRGWSVTLAATREGDASWAPAFARHTPDVFVLPTFLPRNDHPRFLRYLIASRRPDVVLLSHSELAYLLLPYLRAHEPGPVYLDLCHLEEEGWQDGGYPRYAVGLQECLDLNLVTSRHLRSWMTGRGADPKRVEVVTTNVDGERWRRDPAARARLRAEWQVREDEPVVLFAGRLCAQKQPRVLARTLLDLTRRGVAFRGVIAGDGEDREALAAELAHPELTGRVSCLGPVPRERMHELMSASDLFFLPSRWEGVAVSIYEAMAMELAVVAADVGGQAELVVPGCGVLVRRPADGDEADEITAWSDALASLLRDPERRVALGRAARARVEAGFRIDQMVERLLACFERAREYAAAAPRLRLPAPLAREWAAQALARLGAETELEREWNERRALEARIEELRACIDDLERGKSWLEGQRAAFRRAADERARAVEELRAWADVQGRGKAWLEQERERYRRLAEQRRRTIDELRTWTDALSRGKSWLETQQASWQRTAAEREQIIREQQEWIRALEAGKRWLEDELGRARATVAPAGPPGPEAP